ncbi:delta 1-pyrroline-5-carboxylate reductase [Ascosphaera acerosa]|nr:delta 1-pyrroline-5-carboxylate reductase [Ascosphaera acerosa]
MAGEKDVTLAVIGCGTMGIAVLGGVLASLAEARDGSAAGGTATPGASGLVPTRFIACVRSDASAQRIRDSLGKYGGPLEIYQNDNIRAINESDAVLLACKPFMIEQVLGAPGMAEALKGKLLMTILAGVTEARVLDVLYKHTAIPESGRCRVVRVLPNTAALVRQSATAISQPDPPLAPEWDAFVHWIFSRCGTVVTLPPHAMDAATALGGSGPALAALCMEGLADGGVAMGIPRAQANQMAAQVMRGTAALVQNGEHPAILREKVSTPGGCTIGGLLVLEEAGVRGQISRSVREATVVATELGKGKQAANGTRW